MSKGPPVVEKDLSAHDWALIGTQAWNPAQREVIAVFRGRPGQSVTVKEIRITLGGKYKRTETVKGTMISRINGQFSRVKLPYRIRVVCRGKMWPDNKLQLVVVDISA